MDNQQFSANISLNYWPESIAVGSLDFVEKIKSELGFKAAHREFEPLGEAYALRESAEAYGDFGRENGSLISNNTVAWKLNAASTAL